MKEIKRIKGPLWLKLYSLVGSCVGLIQLGPAHYEPCTIQDLQVVGPISPGGHPSQMQAPDHYWRRRNRVLQQCPIHSLPWHRYAVYHHYHPPPVCSCLETSQSLCCSVPATTHRYSSPGSGYGYLSPVTVHLLVEPVGMNIWLRNVWQKMQNRF